MTVDVSWEMCDASAAIISEFAIMYVLTAHERGWKIVSVTPLDAGLAALNPTGAHAVVPASLRGRGT